MRRVHRDRAVYLGDPDFVDVPVARLINEYYADGPARFHPHGSSATPSASLPGVDAAPAGTQTTHFSVLDGQGNMVAATLTLNFFFGSGLMVPGTGILLNNQMDDFSVEARRAERLPAHRRRRQRDRAEEAAAVVVHADVRRRARRAS